MGSYDDSSGVEHGFLKDGETYTTIDVPGAMYTVAYGINNRGAIVGYWGNLSGWSEGFVRSSAGTVTVVDFPGALETQIGNINDHGDICGLWVDPRPACGPRLSDSRSEPCRAMFPSRRAQPC